jgi:hypothetical protein
MLRLDEKEELLSNRLSNYISNKRNEDINEKK